MQRIQDLIAADRTGSHEKPNPGEWRPQRGSAGLSPAGHTEVHIWMLLLAGQNDLCVGRKLALLET